MCPRSTNKSLFVYTNRFPATSREQHAETQTTTHEKQEKEGIYLQKILNRGFLLISHVLRQIPETADEFLNGGGDHLF